VAQILFGIGSSELGGICELNFLPQGMEINSPQPVDVSAAGLLYDFNGL